MRPTLAVLVALAAAPVAAATAQLAPEQRQAILDYKLSLPRANHLIASLDAITKYVVSQPDFRERMKKAMKMTPAERVAAMEKDAPVSAILKANSLTAKEYVVGVVALRMAMLAAQGATGPTVVASPGNIAFAKANLAQLKPKMDAVDGLAKSN